jgi:hypothetical protein
LPAARELGILTVGVVTKPLHFEGTRRMKLAEAGINELQKSVDTLIVIPNQNLFLVAKAETTFKEAFQLADEVLQQGVRSITDLMVMPGLINLDFADVRSVMGEMGKAMMGTGEAEGDDRAVKAAEKAISNPLLDDASLRGARGVLIRELVASAAARSDSTFGSRSLRSVRGNPTRLQGFGASKVVKQAPDPPLWRTAWRGCKTRRVFCAYPCTTASSVMGGATTRSARGVATAGHGR